jgi:hypothetical protein
MHAEYLPKTREAAEARILEECLEVGVAYAKMQRFGRESQPPWEGPTNEAQFLSEVKDVHDAIERYLKDFI